MENDRGFQGSKENLDKNTEYIPTRCRITKPIPPKPATNPMQFVKITPSKLLCKAHEQIKKAEEIKVVRSGIQDDAEDWQANLDNWKSSRRKRQEPIIQRVVEVKKFELQETERTRRKSKTFHEILEEKGRRTKLNIPIYDDDSNDLSDLGLGNSSNRSSIITNSSETNSEDKLSVDTDLKSSDFENKLESSDSQNNFENDTHSENYEFHDSNKNKNQWDKRQIWNRPSDDSNGYSKTETSSWIEKQETVESTADYQRETTEISNNENINQVKKYFESIEISDKNENSRPNVTSFTFKDNQITEDGKINKWRNNINEGNDQEQQQYTYESAIQGYRSRVKSNLSNKFFQQVGNSQNSESFDSETNIIVPKGSILKRKELFESEKVKVEMNTYDSPTSKRLYEDLVNTQSLKERLQSLEKCTGKPNSAEAKKNAETSKSRSSMLASIKSDLEKSTHKWEENATTVINNKWDEEKPDTIDRSASPETNIFVNKIEKFRYSLENLSGDNKEGSDYGASNYPASNSPMDLLGSSQYCDTDREDSGIHTADVSCSVSQADEPVEDTFLNLNMKYENTEMKCDNSDLKFTSSVLKFDNNDKYDSSILKFGNDDKYDSSVLKFENNDKYENSVLKFENDNKYENTDIQFENLDKFDKIEDKFIRDEMKYESNSEISEKYSPSECLSDISEVQPEVKHLSWPAERVYGLDIFSPEDFPLGPPPATLEPPKEKPPPPPPPGEPSSENLNEARRIKKELRMKRSSFLGINPEDQLDDENADNIVKKPPDITSFLQRETRLEKQLYKKTQGSYSEAGDSQDSGVELDKGRLSTDTWCNSIPDCSNMHHDRQGSEPYTESSVTFEEDEIVKKEKEIIALVEKEEQWRGRDCEYRKPDLTKSYSAPKLDLGEPSYSTCNENVATISPMDAEHFEMIQVKHELHQLEQEEIKRQRENLVFRESQTLSMDSRNPLRNKRLSLEDISNPAEPHVCMYQSDPDYRKSMPELQHNAVNFNAYPPNMENVNHLHGSPVRPARPRLPEQYDRDELVKRQSKEELANKNIPQQGTYEILGNSQDLRNTYPIQLFKL